MKTVIIPAHNEARVIGRLLGRLVSGENRGELDIIVVANGCTDDTAQVAGGYGPPVRVLDIPVPSKRSALEAGNEAAKGFPRIYLDADVELGADDIEELDRGLRVPGVLAAVPARELDLARSAWPVRWYYDIWQRIPSVRNGLFGRGVIAVNEAGYQRLAELPPLMADDLAASLAFGPGERSVIPTARVVVHAPRTTRDLLRRRVRVVTGVEQIERSEEAPESAERTSVRDLCAIVAANPLLAPKLTIFLLVTVIARRQGNRAAEKNDYSTWLRDISSRELALSSSHLAGSCSPRPTRAQLALLNPSCKGIHPFNRWPAPTRARSKASSKQIRSYYSRSARQCPISATLKLTPFFLVNLAANVGVLLLCACIGRSGLQSGGGTPATCLLRLPSRPMRRQDASDRQHAELSRGRRLMSVQ